MSVVFLTGHVDAQTCVKGSFGSLTSDQTFSSKFTQVATPPSCFSGDRFWDFYSFNGTAGQAVTFILTFVPPLTDSKPMISIARDANSSPLTWNLTGDNPLVRPYTLPSTGNYVVIVSTLNSYGLATYTLRGFSGVAPTPSPIITPTVARSQTPTPTPTPPPSGSTPTPLPPVGATPTTVPRMPVVLFWKS